MWRFGTGFLIRTLGIAILTICANLILLVAVHRCQAQSPYEVLKTTRAGYALYEPPLAVVFEKYFSSSQGLPVLVYLHGSYETNETRYDAFCRDVAEAGFVVVFPKFDASLFSDKKSWYANAVRLTYEALIELKRLPSESGGVGYYHRNTAQIALAGHSAGGMFALKMAEEFSILSPLTGIGRPRALILHDPGGFAFGGTAIMQNSTTWMDSLYTIPRDTELVILASAQVAAAESKEHSDRDAIVYGNSCFAGVWTRAWRKTNIEAARKNFFIVSGGHNAVSWDYWFQGGPYLNATVDVLDSALNKNGSFARSRTDAVNFSSFLNTTDFAVRPYAGPINNPFEYF